MADISENGGEAILIEARLLVRQSDADVRALFDAARDADYADLQADRLRPCSYTQKQKRGLPIVRRTARAASNHSIPMPTIYQMAHHVR